MIKLIIVGIKKIEKLNLKIMYVYGMFFFLKKFCICIGKSFFLDNLSYVIIVVVFFFYYIF